MSDTANNKELERRFEYNELLGRLDERLKNLNDSVVPFRTCVEVKFSAHEHVHELESRTAILALAEINRRLVDMNHMREQINQERGSFVPRAEYEIKHTLIIDLISSLQKFQWMVTGALVTFQILIGIVVHYWH